MTMHPNTRKVDALSTAPVGSVRGTPPQGRSTLLNVRLRRCTTMLIVHDHMLLGTYIAWSMEDAESSSVRHGHYAFPIM
jgi:hypothetical protein